MVATAVWEQLIWAVTAIGVVVVLVKYFGPSLKRRIEASVGQYGTESDRELEIEARRLEIEQIRLALEVRKGTLDAETEAKLAQLKAEAAEHEAAARAAADTIGDATEAKRRVIAARTAAEIALAEEFARDAHSGDVQTMQILMDGYQRAVTQYRNAVETIPTFANWAGRYAGGK